MFYNEEQQLIFCQNVRYLRRKHKITQVMLAKLLKISVKSLASIEKGVIPKHLDYTIPLKLCAFFDKSSIEMAKPMYEIKNKKGQPM